MIKKLKVFKDRPKLGEFADFVLSCLIIVVVVILINSFIIISGYVPSGSMEDLIMTHDRILANRTAYWGDSVPQRGDIVVFYAPDEKHPPAPVNSNYPAIPSKLVLYVKRVIGLPGETVTIKNNHVYIENNKTKGESKLLEEPYIPEGMVTMPLSATDTFTVPENCYFMLGDNRTNSSDSRAWRNTYVPVKDILGKVFWDYSLWPLDSIRFKTISSYNGYNI